MTGNPADEQNVSYTYDLVGSGGVNIPCGSFSGSFRRHVEALR
jgi:hypothetical protein